MSTAEVTPTTSPALGLIPGELVRVRSASEIFATLGPDGTLEGLPFMPEMLKYCGDTLPVIQRADTTCAGAGAVRRMYNTVHLQRVRCDGSAHDGCQASCLMFWKEAWLERVEDAAGDAPTVLTSEDKAYVADTLLPATKVKEADDDGPTIYRCQATEIPQASEELRFREIDQYARGLQNWKWPKIVKGLVIETFNLWQAWSKRHLPQRLLIKGGNSFPFVIGRLEKGKTPKETLDLQPGDLVRVKSKEEIIATLDSTNRNRGLYFDSEASVYCGRVGRVQARVNNIIEESNGEMVHIKSDCIILEGVVCAGDYHRFCTRAIYTYWREIWLEKIDPEEAVEVDAPCANRWCRT